MKYIIMCGGHYKEWQEPRQLCKIHGEEVVARTIRLLRENGVEDIAISSDNPVFEKFGVPVLVHNNGYYARAQNDVDGFWCEAFYPTDEPTCYLFGDVVFSPAAIKKIVETETKDIDFFGSAPPFAPEYIKRWVEPFAFKVQNTVHFHKAIRDMKELADTCWRSPIAWDLWYVISGVRIDIDDYQKNYIVINDYTCDIDHRSDIPKLEARVTDGCSLHT